MILRIVKMSFHPHTADAFLELFQQKQSTIRSFPGCHHLELWKGLDEPHQYFTYSIWQDPEALENYRRSTFFTQTWKDTKKLFASKAEAWTVQQTAW